MSPTRDLPKGETPDEARERVAPTPTTFSLSLSGSGDHGSKSDLEEAFRTFVLAARTAGFDVSGTLSGSVNARRSADDTTLIPADVIHINAGDVASPDEDDGA